MSAAYLTFLSQLPSRFDEIGSVIPSGKALSHSMTSPIRRASPPRRILEVGPGTGPFTREILALMRSEDQLVVSEINSALLAGLQKSLLKDKNYVRHQDRVQFIEGPVQKLLKNGGRGPYDVIICSLPFLNFTPETVEEIMSLFHESLVPAGTLAFFEYAGLREWAVTFTLPSNKRRVRGVEDVIRSWKDRAVREGSLGKELTLLNFPPANSYFLTF